MKAIITDVLVGGSFYGNLIVDGVQTNNRVKLYPAGKLRINKIRILPNDEVVCEMSPYDLTQGRITYRNK